MMELGTYRMKDKDQNFYSPPQEESHLQTKKTYTENELAGTWS